MYVCQLGERVGILVEGSYLPVPESPLVLGGNRRRRLRFGESTPFAAQRVHADYKFGMNTSSQRRDLLLLHDKSTLHVDPPP